MKYLIALGLVFAVALLALLSGFNLFQLIYINLAVVTAMLWWDCFKPARND